MTIGIILLVIAAAELGLGLKFLLSRQRNQTTLFYGLFAVGSAIYVGANAFGYLDWLMSLPVAEHLGWVGGSLATIFFLPFTFSFPLPRRTYRELWTLILWPLLIFVPGFLFSGELVKYHNIVRFGLGYKVEPGPLLWAFLLFVIIFWSWSIFNLIRNYQKTDGINRKNLGIVLLGTLVSLIIVLVMDVYQPLTQISRLGYVGALCTAFWLSSSAYILLKK